VVARRELALLAAEERGRGRMGNAASHAVKTSDAAAASLVASATAQATARCRRRSCWRRARRSRSACEKPSDGGSVSSSSALIRSSTAFSHARRRDRPA
jgi:hypothetical protein